MDPLTAVILTKSLDGLAMRAAATAQNIAAATSSDPRTVRVDFEGSLRVAAGQGADHVARLTPTMTRADAVAGGETRVDLELATASETALRYSALLDLLGRQMQLARTVIRGGQ